MMILSSASNMLSGTPPSMPGWEVTADDVRVPTGLSLREDDHLVYVCADGAVVAVFSASLPRTALQAALDGLAMGAP
jgi:hypothetical protein